MTGVELLVICCLLGIVGCVVAILDEGRKPRR